MAQAEPEALRLLAPRRGLFATVESKSKNNSKNAESKTREYSWNCQTSTASPAEPGGLPFRLDGCEFVDPVSFTIVMPIQACFVIPCEQRLVGIFRSSHDGLARQADCNLPL